MFGTLIVSRPTTRPVARFLVPALLIHAAILSTAVKATAGAAEHPMPAPRDTMVLFPSPAAVRTADPARPSGLRPRMLPAPHVPDIAPMASVPFEVPLSVPDLGSLLKTAFDEVTTDSADGISRVGIPMVESDVDQPPALLSGPRPAIRRLWNAPASVDGSSFRLSSL
jgi:hypothetical protein